MQRLFNWLDGLTKLSPLDKAMKELEQTQTNLLEALSNKEHYEGLSSILAEREKRLARYIKGATHGHTT